jgi:hypothetical protein
MFFINNCVYRFAGIPMRSIRESRSLSAAPHRSTTCRGARVARLRCPILRAGKSDFIKFSRVGPIFELTCTSIGIGVARHTVAHLQLPPVPV